MFMTDSVLLIVLVQTWIYKHNRGGFKTEATIPRTFWNHHEAAMKGEAKTTCDLEEWHKDLHSRMAHYPQKTIWYLLKFLRNQFGESCMILTGYSFHLPFRNLFSQQSDPIAEPCPKQTISQSEGKEG